MPVLNCQNRDITAQVRLDFTPPLNMAANFNTLSVVITDPLGVWPATPDPTRWVKQFGLMIDRGDGQGWVWFAYFGNENDPSAWIPFGYRMRNGSLPLIRAQTGSAFGVAGHRLRVSIITDSDINLGATATVD